MAIEDTLDQPEGEEPEGHEPPAGTVTKDDLAQVLEAINKRTEMFEERLDALVAQRTQNPRAAESEEADDLGDVTDDDDDVTRLNKTVAKQLSPLKKQLKALAQVSVGTMQKLSERAVAPKLEHYNRFKKEIDARLAMVSADMRAQPEALEYAYKTVLAEHFDELMAERLEAERRAGATGGASPGAPKTGRGSGTGPKLLTPADLGWDADQISAVEGRGGIDAWSRRMSGGRYKNFQDYAKAHFKIRARQATQETA